MTLPIQYESLSEMASNIGEDNPPKFVVVFPNGVITHHSIIGEDSVTFESFREFMNLPPDQPLELIDAELLSDMADIRINAIIDEKSVYDPNLYASSWIGQLVYGPVIFINASILEAYDDSIEEALSESELESAAEESDYKHSIGE